MKMYKCYSINMHNYLRDEGFRYISSGFNNITNKVYYVYVMSDSLSYALNVWTNRNKN